MSKTSHAVNITPTASADGLRERLEREARRRGLNFRQMIGDIYSYACTKSNKAKFHGPLQDPMGEGGKHIGAEVEESVKNSLTQWAKERKVSRGEHCRYLLEKTLEDGLLDKVFPQSLSDGD